MKCHQSKSHKHHPGLSFHNGLLFPQSKRSENKMGKYFIHVCWYHSELKCLSVFPLSCRLLLCLLSPQCCSFHLQTHRGHVEVGPPSEPLTAMLFWHWELRCGLSHVTCINKTRSVFSSVDCVWLYALCVSQQLSSYFSELFSIETVACVPLLQFCSTLFVVSQNFE